MNIEKRLERRLALILDTETIDIKDLDTFDIGFVLIDVDSGEILVKEGYLIEEVFGTDLYKRAYYYEKNNEIYEKMLEANKINIKKLSEVRGRINEIALKYKPDYFGGFVINFDIRALNYSYQKYGVAHKNIHYSKMPFEIIDIPILFTHLEAITTPEYILYCKENNLLTKTGVRTTAEAMYGFIMNDSSHREEHTALSDSIEEAQILHYLFKKYGNDDNFEEVLEKVINLSEKGTPSWRSIQKYMKEMKLY